MSYPTKSEIITAVINPNFIKDKYLQSAAVQIGHSGRPVLYTGGYSMVFQLLNRGEKLAFRVWHIEILEIKDRYKKISAYLNKINLHYFSEFTYVENGLLVNGQLLDISRMKWVEGNLLKEFIGSNLHRKPILEKLAENFLFMINDLHKNKVSHGDLQHGNILITDKIEIKLVDYDSICVPEIEGQNEVVTGLKGYQHPTRFTKGKSSSKADYFSELVIYLSILAISENPTLWAKYDVANTETLIFTPEDFLDWDNSNIKFDLNLMSNKIKTLTKVMEEFISQVDYLNIKPFSLYFEKPTVKFFKSDREVVLNGGQVLLSWEVENALKIEINNGIGDVTNVSSIRAMVNENSTYTLVAKNLFEEVCYDINIKIFPTPIIESLMIPTPEFSSYMEIKNVFLSAPYINFNIKLKTSVNLSIPKVNTISSPVFNVQIPKFNPPPKKNIFKTIKNNLKHI